MTTPPQYMPVPANLARVEKDGENWTLGLVWELVRTGVNLLAVFWCGPILVRQ
jgi:hypothetical protein